MPFDFLPAIDLLDGDCVRLFQGNYERETVYNADPIAQVQIFAEAGASWVHVVDLDAARTGDPLNRTIVGAIAAAVEVPIQVGGGVRSVEAAQHLFDLGVERVVLGTAAVEKPELAEQLTKRGYRVAIALDSRNGRIATHGWEIETELAVVDIARRFEDLGVDALVVTEICRDGTLEGPDIAGIKELLVGTTIDVIASGGVGNVAHLETLLGLESAGRRLSGVIVGRAIYEGTLDLAAALRLCGAVTL